MNKKDIIIDRFFKLLVILIFIILCLISYTFYNNVEKLEIELADKNAEINTLNEKISSLNSELTKEWLSKINLKNQCNFMDKYVAICLNDWKNLYHKYSCEDYNNDYSFYILSKDDAKKEGFKPCSKCQDNDSSTTTNSNIVYITDTGNKYHKEWCSYLESKNSIDKDKAIKQGYEPCSRCNP